MAYVIDKETKLFWKEYGKGLTKDAVEAYEYSDNAAHCLLRLFPDEVYIVTVDHKTGAWLEHNWSTDTKGMPMRTKIMRDKELVWVIHDGLWMATDRQTLILGTLLAYNTPTPGRPEPMKDVA